MGLFKAVAENSLNNFIETADFNKDKIPDKEQLLPVVSKVGECVDDIEQAVDWTVAGKHFSEFCTSSKQLLGVINPDLVKDHKVDPVQLFSELSKPANREAAGHALWSLMQLAETVNQAKLQEAVKDLSDAKNLLESYLHPAPSKKK